MLRSTRLTENAALVPLESLVNDVLNLLLCAAKELLAGKMQHLAVAALNLDLQAKVLRKNKIQYSVSECQPEQCQPR